MTTTLDDLYSTVDRLGLTPGWVNRDEPIFWAAPEARHRPARWGYASAHEALGQAGGLIDVELAERRNLILRNPVPGNGFATTRTIVCAYQMILPGEVAPTHRHSPHAIRVMLDATGAYSVVDGEQVPMETGDVVLTPGGKWHGHGHSGDEPAYWLDALDIPLVHLLEPMYYQEHPARYEPIVRTAVTSPYRHANADIQRRLDAAPSGQDGTTGALIDLAAPGIPTMGLTMERLEAGTRTTSFRSTANRVFVAMSGEGATVVDGITFEWTRGDTVVVPSWSVLHHRVSTDAVLFGISDEPLMRALSYFRREII